MFFLSSFQAQNRPTYYAPNQMTQMRPNPRWQQGGRPQGECAGNSAMALRHLFVLLAHYPPLYLLILCLTPFCATGHGRKNAIAVLLQRTDWTSFLVLTGMPGGEMHSLLLMIEIPARQYPHTWSYLLLTWALPCQSLRKLPSVLPGHAL